MLLKVSRTCSLLSLGLVAGQGEAKEASPPVDFLCNGQRNFHVLSGQGIELKMMSLQPTVPAPPVAFPIPPNSRGISVGRWTRRTAVRVVHVNLLGRNIAFEEGAAHGRARVVVDIGDDHRHVANDKSSRDYGSPVK